ncbi:hypothetical protein [Luteolibacter luteus]|uniref:Uncharacterized protein n=1 Tax=Luteolibacter luteus TaxID=2728835 RepID=A0A858RRQ9_9BACT|nr:hypothetical protein [Luteolibacter luteus]QJE99108.1 hypothetical protein HHL09_26125 [Luteolibacter luteus]
MTPFAKAALCHQGLRSAWSFAEIVEAHAQSGYVVVTPEICLLFRAVRRDWSEAELCDPLLYSPEPDCWHVWLLAGDYRQAMRWMPFPLPWVSFHRRGKWRVMEMEEVELLVGSRPRRSSQGRM